MYYLNTIFILLFLFIAKSCSKNSEKIFLPDTADYYVSLEGNDGNPGTFAPENQ